MPSAMLLAPTLITLLLPAPDTLKNGNFEDGRAGDSPSGWLVPTAGFRAVLRDASAFEGSLCVELSGTAGQAPFGNVMQRIPAAAFRGKRVRLSAAIRTGGATRAQMWLRVDRAGGQPGFFDNMADRPVTGVAWKRHEIVGNVAVDAEHINVGLMVLPSGSAWLDDVRLEPVATVVRRQAEPPRALKRRGLTNLVALAGLVGYVRHFHPADQAARTDWDAFTVEAVARVEPARNARELVATLEELFRPVAPTVSIHRTGRRPRLPDALRAPRSAKLAVVTWSHDGFGDGAVKSVYRSERKRRLLVDGQVPDDVRRPDDQFRADLGGGVSCAVPLSVLGDARGTLPHVPGDAGAESKDDVVTEYSGDDRATRLAGVILAWNVLQHFYPYFDVVDTDWEAALTGALRSAANDADAVSFPGTLRRLVAKLHDGHGRVTFPGEPPRQPLPLLWDVAEGKLVITVARADLDLRAGDIVEAIDGTAAKKALDEVGETISSPTPQWRRHRGLTELRLRSDPVTLTMRSTDGKRREVTVAPDANAHSLREPRPDVVAEVRPGVVYVDLDRLDQERLDAELPRLRSAKALVLDLRGYPGTQAPLTLLAHLTEKPLESPQWHIPHIELPDRREIEYRRSGWPVTPRKPTLTARRVFITDGRAISAAETFLGIVAHHRVGEIVGEPTAGTNGNVNAIELPGGYRIAFTGMRVLTQDGKQHHGRGIRPTIPAKRTIAGIRAERDELLERAIEVAER